MSASIRTNRARRGLRAGLAGVVLSGAALCLAALAPQDAGPRPIPEVERLVRMTGLWDTSSVLTGFPARTGFAKLSMLGGNWLVEEYKSEGDDKIVEGRTITGWDPDRQRYAHAWINTADTRLNVVDMLWDEESESLVSEPQLLDLGQGPANMRTSAHMPDKDTIVFTIRPVAPDALPALILTYSRNR